MAPIDFKKIFANRDKYPDTMKFTLGDGAEVSLADLREYDASVGGDLRKELDRQRLEKPAIVSHKCMLISKPSGVRYQLLQPPTPTPSKNMLRMRCSARLCSTCARLRKATRVS